MGLYPITINTAATAQPHIFSEDDACIYEAIFGSDCVFNMGNKFKSTILSNNKIRLSDGVLQVGGHVARIKSGDYEDLTIANGTSGKKRADIIYCRFQKSGDIDNMQILVKQGTTGTSYLDPALTQNDLYVNGTTREMPLYRVKIDGINIVAVEQMFYVRSKDKYDVGDIYCTFNAENPATKFGGTWALIGEGRCLVCVDTTQTEFNTVKKTGGEKTHTLTWQEQAPHSHGLQGSYAMGWGNASNVTFINNCAAEFGTCTNNNPIFKHYRTSEEGGENQPHNNLQPYITCYIWYRVT